jgi:predicted site-specific integrase-resolvase
MKMGDVQRALGVKSPTTIKKWIKAGRFPNATRVNGQWRLPAAEIYAMRDAGCRTAELAILSGPQPTGEYRGNPLADLI